MEKDYEIIAVDFDGTLCYSNWPELGEQTKLLLPTSKAGKVMETSSSSGPAVSMTLYQKLSNGVRTKDLNLMPLMIISRRLLNIMEAIAERLPVIIILMIG